MKKIPNKTIVFTFGRMSPPTVGHEKLIRTIETVAKSESRQYPVDAGVFLSHTQDKKKNPLAYKDKIRFAKIAFGNIVKQSSSKTIISLLQELDKTYTRAVMVVGSDRVVEMETLLNKYNNKEYSFEEVKVVSAGERDPDSADLVSGISASLMRKYTADNDFLSFRQGLPSRLRPKAKDVFEMTKEGMGLIEDLEEEKAPLTIAQRRKRAMNMRRIRAKLKTAKARMKRRKASEDKLKQRAQRKARMALRKRFSANKSYADMSPSEKIAVDRRVNKVNPSTLQRIARKMLPQVRRAEMDRLASLGQNKNEDLEASFQNYITEKRFVDYLEESRTSVDGTPAKQYHHLLKKDGSVKIDGRFKMFKKEPAALPNHCAKVTEHTSLKDFVSLIETFIEEVQKENPANREEGSDSVVNIYKSDTPGQKECKTK